MLGDLIGEFAGWSEHECARLPAWPVHETLQYRQAKCSRLAAAGLGATEDVAAIEGRWNREGLDWSGLGETEVEQGSLQRRPQAEFFEGGNN
jgi:hypothetical protein